jgi:hypothetical protein
MALPLVQSDSQVTDGDIVMAVALWKMYAPSQYRYLIDGRGSLVWDAAKKQYYDAGTGKYINALDLRNKAIEPFLLRVKIAMREIDAKLQSRSISLAEWQTQMAQIVKSSQIAAALVAVGGTPNISDIDRAGIAVSVFAILEFLRDFANDIESGKQNINGTLLSRTDLYANATRDAYEEARRNALIAGAIITGAVLRERRVLDSQANHCTTDGGLLGCVELAAKGWQPIGSLPRLYETPCRTNCKCHFEYK